MTVGMIGLGIMGKPMARNLMKAGFTMVVYDIVDGLADELVAAGAKGCASASEVAAQCEAVITMLPDGPEVEAAVFGKGGVLETVKRGTLLIDMSSVSPLVAQKVGAACEARGVDFLDAPVSGGEPGAINATLAIMVGGKPDAFERAVPVFQALGKSITLTGPVGAGNVTKLANQIMVACNIAAMGEALVLATKAGLDPEVVFKAVQGGLAGSNVLNAKAPMVVARNFKPGFRIKLHQKDLRNALLAGEALKAPLPLTGAVQDMLMALMNEGKGELDHSAIVTFLEKMAGVEVKRA